MGFLRKMTGWALAANLQRPRRRTSSNSWSCTYEELELRRVLAAAPVIAGLTYFEGDLGQDTTPDHFEVSFQGGTDSTKLTQFEIRGDQDGDGRASDGDVFFDTARSLPGAGGFADFQIDVTRSDGIGVEDIVSVQVSSDGLWIRVQVDNFEAGDLLAFTVDVDEVERFRTDKIASGVEFEGSRFNAVFEDELYVFSGKNVSVNHVLEHGHLQEQISGFFYDEYDDLLDEAGRLTNRDLELTRDNQTGFADRSAAAIVAYDLELPPISISGNVFYDANLDCVRDEGEQGIDQVEIELQKINDVGVYETVGVTQTDRHGHYEFGHNLGLLPGNYRLVEIQPDRYVDVGATVGQIGEVKIGSVLQDAGGQLNVLSDIVIASGNTAATQYNFCEVRAAQVSGHVWHDLNDDGVRDSREPGIANVSVRVVRTGSIDGVVSDPFEAHLPVVVQTGDDGYFVADMLPPGVYELHEINVYPTASDPLEGFLDGQESIGRVAGGQVGSKTNDRFQRVVLESGQAGLNYDFGELRPSAINGFVSVTARDGTCVEPLSDGHRGIEGVMIQLFTPGKRLVATTQTDANGFYEFQSLRPGTYGIVEVQPVDYLDGDQSLGRVDGDPSGFVRSNDRFNGIRLLSGQQGTMYNFCEQTSAELCGSVWHDANNNGRFELTESGISGVLIQLFDDEGQQVGQQRTDAEGAYCFVGLGAGEYTVREVQPNEFLDGFDLLGTVNSAEQGSVRLGSVQNDVFRNISLLAGDRGQDYDFAEFKTGSIAGLVYYDLDRDCHFDWDSGEIPLPNVLLQLIDGNGDWVANTTTGLGGYYEFDNLLPGEYSIRQEQPDGYFSVGQTSGWISGIWLPGPGESTIDNRIFEITLQSAQQLVQYNFCEAVPVNPGILSAIPMISDPARSANPARPIPGTTSYLGLAGSQAGLTFEIGGASGGRFQVDGMQDPYTWHLSVVNAGQPRSIAEATQGASAVWQQVAALKETDWTRFSMAEAKWTFAQTGQAGQWTPGDREIRFGMVGGTPVVGDFDGDGIDEIAVFQDGYWLIDLNRNGQWDSEDLMARLGGDQDRPVVGDWDGDGKEDIGIYGPMWPNDIEAINQEPGLPNPENTPFTRPKNIPPEQSTASDGARIMKLTSFGKQRADLVDHVFGMGAAEDVPIAGDWNGNGVRSIGKFNQGVWHLDMNGDGEFNHHDIVIPFGTSGDYPVTGDFNGDGIDEIAVYRAGTWLIDVNGNRELDADDVEFEMGTADDLPIAGDWDGDGVDQPGLYREAGPEPESID